MEPLSRTWLILASLPRSWLAFAQSCMAMVSLPRSWQDYGKILARLARNLPWVLAMIPWLRKLGWSMTKNNAFGGEKQNEESNGEQSDLCDLEQAL